MGKRMLGCLVLAICMLGLGGCMFGNVDEMYALPKSSEAYVNLQAKINQEKGSAEYIAPLSGENTFTVRVEDIVKYIGLPTKEEVKNRNYDEAIMRPFNKAVEEIESISGGSLQMSFEYDNINTFMAGQMTIGVDDTMTDYIQKLEKTKATRQLESRNKRRRKTPEPS